MLALQCRRKHPFRAVHVLAAQLTPFAMPKFAANITMMFTEWPFIDRIEAAAQAGFRAVELQYPYDHPPETIAAKLRTHAVENVLFNAAPGNIAAGERGLASLPGREAEFREAFALSLR